MRSVLFTAVVLGMLASAAYAQCPGGVCPMSPAAQVTIEQPDEIPTCCCKCGPVRRAILELRLKIAMVKRDFWEWRVERLERRLSSHQQEAD